VERDLKRSKEGLTFHSEKKNQVDPMQRCGRAQAICGPSRSMSGRGKLRKRRRYLESSWKISWAKSTKNSSRSYGRWSNLLLDERGRSRCERVCVAVTGGKKKEPRRCRGRGNLCEVDCEERNVEEVETCRPETPASRKACTPSSQKGEKRLRRLRLADNRHRVGATLRQAKKEGRETLKKNRSQRRWTGGMSSTQPKESIEGGR